MLFHDSEVNRERETEGRPAVNGVWPWGGGILPGAARGPWTEMLAADPLALGLARLAGLSTGKPPDTVAAWRQSAEPETDSLVVLEHVRYDAVDGNVQHWRDQIEALERDWFTGCRELLSGGAVDALYLYPCNGWVYRLRRSNLRRFWRRPRPLVDYP
jgi:hypothetical protein